MVSTDRPPQRRFNVLQWITVLVGALLLFDLVTFLLAERQWFQELDYLQVFAVRLRTQGGLGLFGCFTSFGFLLSNLVLARQHSHGEPPADGDRPFSPGRMSLRLLLPLTFLLSFTIGMMLIYHGQIAVSHWHPNLSLYNSASTPLPLRFRPQAIWQIAQQFVSSPEAVPLRNDNVTYSMLQLGRWLVSPLVQLGVLILLAIAILFFPQVMLGAIALLMSLGFGLVLSEHWTEILPYFFPTSFNLAEPLFEQDIGFYVFRLPLWELLEFWMVGLFVLTLLSVSLIYLLSGNSLSQGRFLGFSSPQQRHLFGLGGMVMLAIALSYWLDRYALLFSRQGVSYGASFTNVLTQLPVYTFLSIAALVLGLAMLWRTMAWRRKGLKRRGDRSSVARKWAFPMLPTLLGLYLLTVIIGGLVLPGTVQRLIVQPNELELEQPYITRTIALTRQAFDLEKIDVQTFDPQYDLTYDDILANELTVNNIRVWDKRPLLETNRQLQRIRLYYEFPDADLDRYTLATADGGTELRQVLIAARELDYNSIPAEAQTWVNKHLIYTHGYGFTLSPVNVAGEGGLPDYFVQGIEQIPSDPQIQASIPIASPRIYYGELTNTYVMTQTTVRELDYPSGSDNVYNSYDGQGGIRVAPWWQRLLFAKHLRDWRMLLAENFTSDTRVLFRRNIGQRVRSIAPFLRFDRDPYLVVANTGEELEGGLASPSYLYWIIDAYTTSNRYPYSDPLGNDFNYIRNSVKVVVDAYNGTVWFYVADERDPVIATWSRIFPGMFRSLNDMPETLRTHIRYPPDFYLTQSQQLMVYHMTEPQVFYNREDQWRAPNEIYAGEPRQVEPYYLILSLPDEPNEEFILLRPFTPVQRNNMIAWLSARSDGEQYGNMLLYNFPKQELVFGPEQIEARINQDPVISQQISLWNRRGASAIQGNLLVIPVQQSLLYVEPLYLEADQNQLPILARVIVAYGDRIVMAETLEQALEAVFLPEDSATPAIIRSLEQEPVESLE
ncbi:UPF0182 family protein [Oculatella sp. LEGE 06141]|uniref:UPF0182 family protein n=1 Tax=Oculatella sp. LEGE 06141 TaxID=1828648 RepID=UPI0018811011|nr:UPF0182 family protein [Oculatella sp. LEGE 06141]MBE9178393.1 UPF0182 family protein [Oculatella sp. LEGE 06141]